MSLEVSLSHHYRAAISANSNARQSLKINDRLKSVANGRSQNCDHESCERDKILPLFNVVC
jgi:hypothetical protein